MSGLVVVPEDTLRQIIRDELGRLGLSDSDPPSIDQRASALGKKRHNAAVRRLCAQGHPGAAVVGRRHLLSRGAYAEELARLGREPLDGGELDPAERLRRDLAGGRAA